MSKHPDKRAKRVVCLRESWDNSAMSGWIGAQQQLAVSHSNFELRFLDWPIPTDGISMALLDRDTVFLLFAGLADDRMHGMSVRSKPVAEYLHEYFDNLWKHSHTDVEVGARPLNAAANQEASLDAPS